MKFSRGKFSFSAGQEIHQSTAMHVGELGYFGLCSIWFLQSKDAVLIQVLPCHTFEMTDVPFECPSRTERRYRSRNTLIDHVSISPSVKVRSAESPIHTRGVIFE